MTLIQAHGGKLINRELTGNEQEKWLTEASNLKAVTMNNRQVSDVEMIATGGFSPLEGFMGKADYESVIQNKRLSNGLAWTIPITLSVDAATAQELVVGETIALKDENGKIIAILELAEIYKTERAKEALLVYGTEDVAHPGVKYLHDCGETNLAGSIWMIERPAHSEHLEYRYDPKVSREMFTQKGWHRIVGFQTRNPVHRAHEYIQKCALEAVDGLFLHPLMGETKSDDIPADIRMECYVTLLDGYYPKDRTILGIFPGAMRYAGPREAIFHAIVRQNYGCSHFIVGRDHAGVGSYYGTFDAHYIFDEFTPEELAITPLFFDHTFYCKKCESMASYKTCPHGGDDHLILSGTKVRDMLNAGETLPNEFTRKEVSDVLMKWAKIS